MGHTKGWPQCMHGSVGKSQKRGVAVTQNVTTGSGGMLEGRKVKIAWDGVGKSPTTLRMRKGVVGGRGGGSTTHGHHPRAPQADNLKVVRLCLLWEKEGASWKVHLHAHDYCSPWF